MKRIIISIAILNLILISSMSTVSAFGQMGDNAPPEAPTITGETTVEEEVEYDYSFTTTDPDGDYVYYYITFGDGIVIVWAGPYLSGQTIIFDHAWQYSGNLNIQAKARDSHGNESDVTTLSIHVDAEVSNYQQVTTIRYPLIFKNILSLTLILQSMKTITSDSEEVVSPGIPSVVESDSSTTITETPSISDTSSTKSSVSEKSIDTHTTDTSEEKSSTTSVTEQPSTVKSNSVLTSVK